jgi:DNA-binding NarL/FixJ family response regulator
MSKEISVLIADDHPIFRDGLRALIRQEDGVSVVGEAADGEQAVSLARDLRPDVMLLDLAMPKLTGLEVLRELFAGPPLPTRTLLLTAAIADQQLTEALRLGARGVVMKDASSQLLVKSIRCVVAGEFWIGRGNVQGLVQALQVAHAAQPADPVKRFGLTARELEVINTIVEGYSNKEIAHRFSISEQTVKHHLSSIFDKVGVSNRLELALFSVNNQLIKRV